MRIPEVAIIDYGVGNLLSVQRALEHCGGRAGITSDPAAILGASGVVLPGVGAFANGMAELCDAGLDGVVREVAARGTPLLAVCLGMQMLLDESEEFGLTRGLGLISGRVIPIPATKANGERRKIPHIGWSELVSSPGGPGWKGSPLEPLVPGDAVYFVHSFMAVPSDAVHRLADAIYDGVAVPGAIGRDNILGCQFHPEKSGEVGLRILRYFLKNSLDHKR